MIPFRGIGETGDILNVKKFGAIGNGTADDTAVIQSCLNSADGGIYLPPGNSRVSGLTTPNRVGGLIVGAGPGVTTLNLLNNSNTNILETFKGFWLLRDFGVEGNSTGQSTGHGIKVSDNQGRTWMDNLWINDCKQNGIYMNGTSPAPSFAGRMNNIMIRGCLSNGIEATTFGYDWELNNVWIGACTGDGVKISSGEWHIANIHSWGNGGHGIHIMGVDNNKILGAYLETNTGFGIKCENNTRGLSLNGGHVWKNTGGGIDLLGSGTRFGAISGVVISDNTGPGITLDACTDMSITGNTIYDIQGGKTQTYAIFGQNATDRHVVVGNIMRAADHVTGSSSALGAATSAANNQV